MQLIWVSGPVGRIYKLDLTLKKLIIGLFVTIFLTSLCYFLSQVHWLRQDTDFAEHEDTALATIVDADLRKKLVEIYSELEFTHKKIKDLEKRLYYAMVWYHTEQQPLYVLENHDKRGWKEYHLDHIYPISKAYYQNIPPEKVGNIKNLRFIHHKENMIKGNTVNEDAKNALRRINRLK